MTKLTTAQVGNNVMLMTLVSSPKAEKSEALERIMANNPVGFKEHDEVYDVRVSINGIDLEFKDFAEEVNRQLDTLLAEAARDLVKELIGTRIQDLTERYDAALLELTDAVESEAARLLGAGKRAP
jgi:hypothetical protein